MSTVSGISSGSSSEAILQILEALATQLASGIGSVGSSSSQLSDSATVSGPGQLISELESLKSSDPTKFKQLLTNAANQLESAAKQAGLSTSQGQFLSSLATKFQDVANGGDISQLFPAAPSGQAQQAYGSSQSNNIQSLLALLDQNQTPSSSGTSLESLLSSLADSQSSSASSNSSTSSSGRVNVQQILKNVFNTLQQALSSLS
jgi:hypothetical protein